jgi:multiple sugar transport system ATP-binding protein
MSVRQNLAFGLKMRKTAKDEINRRVDDVAKILGLNELLDRKPGQLSGGQRQRVAMGRAIVRDPQVFLFDEPLSNLDAKLRVQMRAELKDLHARLKTTTIYVTHDQIEAMTMADKIVIMRDGVVEQAGAPLDLYDQPANIFVAGFIGSPAMNFLSGRVERSDGGAVFVSDAGTKLPLDAAMAASAGKEPVVCGIRPEHISLATAADGLPAEIAVIEPTGSETHLMVKAGSDQLVVLLRERASVKAGDSVRLAASTGDIHLFSAATGNRLR